MRINKFLADAGIASRRAADELIVRGVVTLNGRKAKPGDVVDPAADDVRVQGRIVKREDEAHITIALNKPLGVVTTMRDERGRRSIADLLPRGKRVFPIGRLDAQTTGLILCTSDGELGRRLAHPSFQVPRRYLIAVDGVPGDAALRALTARRVMRVSGGTSFEMTLTSGANREIRRACAQQGLRVLALERVAYGPIELGALRPGEHRVLTGREVQALQQAVRGDGDATS